MLVTFQPLLIHNLWVSKVDISKLKKDRELKLEVFYFVHKVFGNLKTDFWALFSSIHISLSFSLHSSHSNSILKYSLKTEDGVSILNILSTTVLYYSGI